MGYIFIFLSVFANTLKGYCSKHISNQVEVTRDAICLNVIRNAICFLIAAVIVLFKRESQVFQVNLPEFLICFLSGAAMAVFVVCWTLAIKTDAYMLVSACASISFIVPCIFGLFLLNERFTFFRFLSFAASIAALYFLLRYDFSVKGKLNKKQMLLLALVLLSQGLNQSMQKLYTHYVAYKDLSCYTLYSFLFTALLLLLSVAFFKVPQNTEKRPLVKNNMVYILIMAVGLFGASYFQTLAAARVDAIILYPLVNALSLIAGVIMASLFFKEKIKRDAIIGIVFVLAALIASKM